MSPFVFPAGEVHIKGSEDGIGFYKYQIADVRGMSHDELFVLGMWADACYQRGEKTVLLLPYLPGARADRGNPFGAAVYANYINSLYIDQIITLDPHSDVMPILLGEATEGTARQFTVFPFERIIRREIQDATSDQKARPYDGVIAPDKGAIDRATRAGIVMGVPVYEAEKTRDFETGKLTGFRMIGDLPKTGNFLIVDDICDGGGTFNGLADAIAETHPDVTLDLWVTHGVFSKGVEELAKRFKFIHTTNSFYNGTEGFEPPYVKVHNIIPYLYGEINV